MKGYKMDIQRFFLTMNDGLERRFPIHLAIGTYTALEMRDIFFKKVADLKWEITPNAIDTSFFEKEREYFKFFGGDMETLLSKCKYSHSRNLLSDHSKIHRLLTADDIRDGFELFKKNPHKIVRCWASVNNPSDEMYIVANKIYESDIIVFFGSIRWGKMNSVYTQLIERLTWLENRHVTLNESNLLKDKEAGIVAMGHNWNGQDSVELEKQVLKYFVFKTPKELSFNRQWTTDPTDETLSGYKQDYKDFLKEKTLLESLKESYKDFTEWVNKKLFS